MLSIYRNVWRYTHTTSIFVKSHPGRTARSWLRYSFKSAIGSMGRCMNRLSCVIWKNGLNSARRIMRRVILVRRKYYRNSLLCCYRCLRFRCKCFLRNTTSLWRNSISARRIFTTSAQPTVTQRVSSRAYCRQAVQRSLGFSSGF